MESEIWELLLAHTGSSLDIDELVQGECID